MNVFRVTHVFAPSQADGSRTRVVTARGKAGFLGWLKSRHPSASSASIFSSQSPQISAVCGFAHAFTAQLGQVYLVLLADFFEGTLLRPAARAMDCQAHRLGKIQNQRLRRILA
jgi:hypothetical protein